MYSVLNLYYKRKAMFTWVEEGACYDLPSDAGEIMYIDRANYIDNMLHKYYGSRSPQPNFSSKELLPDPLQSGA